VTPYKLQLAEGVNYCCGVSEVYGITQIDRSTFAPESVVMAVQIYLQNTAKKGAFLFEDIDSSHYKDFGVRVRALADYITSEGLGTPVLCPTTKNPNTGNSMTLLMWIINLQGMAEWIRKKDASISLDSWTIAPLQHRRAIVSQKEDKPVRFAAGGALRSLLK
jgi:hypothetical protein